MTKHPNKFDPIEDRLRREFRQQAERVHVTVQTRERFRNMSVQISKRLLLAKNHSPIRADGWRGLMERLRTFWHGTTEIPIPIATVLVAVMVTSLVAASGIGTQNDGFLSQSTTIEEPGRYATLQPDGTNEANEAQDTFNGFQGVEVVSLPMEWVDPIW